MSDSVSHYLKSKTFLGKNVIMTGPTGAIGSIVLRWLLSCGANVVGLVHDQNKLDGYLDDYIKSKQFSFLNLDLESRNKILEKFKEALVHLGGHLDILIMCHGKFSGGNVTEVSVMEFDKNLNINVRANLYLLSIATPFLKVSKGNCVMISSMETRIVEKGDFLHALSKSMINSLVENAALELAPFGVRVNAVAPSFVNSNYRVSDLLSESDNKNYLKQMKSFCLLQKQIVEPEEVAEGILFLASDEAAFMTGEILSIDSGFELNHDLSFQS